MSTSTKPLAVFAPEGADPDPRARAQIETCLADERAVAGALCADHHLGYSMPIGGVVSYHEAISPSGVGFDIACGNKAVRTTLHAQDLAGSARGRRWDLPRLMDEIQQRISFGMGRNRAAWHDEPDDSLFDRHETAMRELDRLYGRRGALSQKARAQLGTVGAGNHYVDVLADEDGRVWVANHFGSRGLGHTIATGFLNLAAGKPFDARGKEREEPTVLPVESELGQFYLAAMRLAGDYAYAGRDYVIDQVLAILEVDHDLEVHNHHNYAWLEHGLWVVRKGATPLTGELAFIGGSMGDGAVVVRGTGDEIGALGSAPHGAGRAMSRTQAAGKRKRSSRYGCPERDCDYWITPQQHDAVLRAAQKHAPLAPGVYCPHHPERRLRKFTHFEHVRDGLVDWQAVLARLGAQGIELRGGAADEAPEAYKSLDAVLAAHANVEVVHRLRPLGVVMAGPDVLDPYKD